MRIELRKGGSVAGQRLIWNSGDAPFNAAAMEAASRTAFAPASLGCSAQASTFDYVFVADVKADRVGALLLTKPKM